MVPGSFIQGKLPPMVRWATSLWMSAQAQLQKPSGILMASEMNSRPSSMRGQRGYTPSPAYSSKNSGFSAVLSTVILTSFRSIYIVVTLSLLGI